jgi:hypothetical protein
MRHDRSPTRFLAFLAVLGLVLFSTTTTSGILAARGDDRGIVPTLTPTSGDTPTLTPTPTQTETPTVTPTASETPRPILTLTPLAVLLNAFTVVPEDNQVRVQWETTAELDNVGFNLYRSRVPHIPDTALNSELIASAAPGSSEGHSYEWIDAAVESGQTYFYWLEAVDVNGGTERFGPVSATVQVPTGVTVSALDSPGTSFGWQWVALAAATLGLALYRRRKPAA